MTLEALSWEHIRLFLALWRTRSIGATGRQLGLDASTASRQLAGLEASLSQPLFLRTRAGLVPTALAAALAPAAEAVEARVIDFTGVLSRGELTLRGVVRLALPEVLDSAVVVPGLARLYDAFPGLRVELVAGAGLADLARDEADLALRLVRPRNTGWVLRRAATLASSVWATRSLAALAPEARRWVVCQPALRSKPEAKWYAQHVDEAAARLTCNRLEAMLAAVSEGLGVGLLPDALACTREHLVRVPVESLPPPVPLWLVAPREKYAQPAVRAVWRFVAERVKALVR